MSVPASGSLTVYLVATSRNRGALGIFHIYGSEAVLTKRLDENVRPKSVPNFHNYLNINELRYGWLREEDGGLIDEVMLAKPAEEMRILMTHGGKAVRESVETYFSQSGFLSADAQPTDLADVVRNDELYDMVLAGCVTEAQVAAVLQAREGKTELPANLLITHRVVLAGAPNAGKSSLFNRLSGYDRAFVDSEAGATRDVVDELISLAGYAVWMGDLPGYAEGGHGLAAAAWEMAVERLRLAESVWFVHDCSQPWDNASAAAARQVAAAACGEVLVILNKADLPPAGGGEPWREYFPDAPVVRVCSLPGGNAWGIIEDAVLEMWK